ncbi:unnamed protein product [Tuber aestivum]|uniref:Uncharacterized protein n=1 Tax=Tuber aestivum TaxID=59557 RepID=A0A292Q008_9PEZI|nr:unnamed protein product [Tuber aestivum]
MDAFSIPFVEELCKTRPQLVYWLQTPETPIMSGGTTAQAMRTRYPATIVPSNNSLFPPFQCRHFLLYHPPEQSPLFPFFVALLVFSLSIFTSPSFPSILILLLPLLPPALPLSPALSRNFPVIPLGPGNLLATVKHAPPHKTDIKPRNPFQSYGGYVLGDLGNCHHTTCARHIEVLELVIEGFLPPLVRAVLLFACSYHQISIPETSSAAMGEAGRFLVVATSIGPEEVFSRDFYRHGRDGRWGGCARSLVEMEIKN